MFYGEFEHLLDVKNRMIIPAKFRTALGDRFILTKGLDKCLFAYTMEGWHNFEEKVKKLPMADEGVRRFTRFFFSGAFECEPDGQGRVLIPNHLRSHAEMDKEIVSIGVMNRVEIWSKDNWQKYNNDSNFIDNELSLKMAELGI